MRVIPALAALWSSLALGQIPDQGRFDYVLYDNRDQAVGAYYFTIGREAGIWRIASEMTVDTRFLMLPVRLKDRNAFTHDGTRFHSFHVDYYKDVPLQRTVRIEVSGVSDASAWTIRTRNGERAGSQQLPLDSFSEVRNLVSRLVRPEAALRPGQVRKARSLDPLTLQVSEVESRGVETESIEFQGRRRELFVMDIVASDGEVRVKKFANGLIYLSRTPDGYALLVAAQAPGF